MSFQITVLKVLAGHPGGRATLADLRHAVAILISSGKDWTDRTKRLAARAPNLDIFSQSFVLRDSAGWCITEAGQAFLASLEASIRIGALERAIEVVAMPVAVPPLPQTRPVSSGRRRRGPARRRRKEGLRKSRDRRSLAYRS